MSRDVQVEGQPIGVPAVEVHSIGAGGGSIAWIDAGGALRVGPRSAGARPGPACYGFGGDGADGHRRQRRARLPRSGGLPRRPARAARRPRRAQAVDVARRPSRSACRRRGGRRHRRGRQREHGRGDPRRLGRARHRSARLHAGLRRRRRRPALRRLARELGIRRVFVPLEAGVFCALGMTVTDVRHDHVLAFHAVVGRVGRRPAQRPAAPSSRTTPARELRRGGLPASR